MRLIRSWRPVAGLFGVLLALAAPAVASAANRYVATTGDDTGNDCLAQATPCQTVQHAADESVDGDRVNVAAGTYAEAVQVTKRVDIYGPFADVSPSDPSRGGASEARIVGVGGAPAVTVTASDVNFDGLSFGPESGPASGRGVYLDGTDRVAVGYSILEHLELAHEIDGASNSFISSSLYRDNDQAITGRGDDGTQSQLSVYENNATAFDLEGSSNAFILSNESTGDGTFVRSRVTDSTSIWGNTVRDVTTDGIVLAGDTSPDIQSNIVSGGGDGLRLEPDGATPVSDPIIDLNSFHDLSGNGLAMIDGAVTGELNLTGNRFFGTGGAGLLVEGNAVAVDATNNWWGCNEGPNQPGCGTYSAPDGATIGADPWTIMSITAFPTPIHTGGETSTIYVWFNTNSDGDTISPQGMGDGVEVDFATTLGTVDPLDGFLCLPGTCFGYAYATLTSGLIPGIATVSATLDAETLTTNVQFNGPGARIAPAGGFDFGPVKLGSFSPLQKFTVKNFGNEDLTIDTLETDSSDFVIADGYDQCTGQTLAPGEFCSTKLRFVPTGTPGPRSATFTVESNAAEASVPLSGTALAPGELTVKPNPFDFGAISVGFVSKQQKFAVKNTGPVPVAVADVELAGPNPDQFVITENTCTGETVVPGESCVLRARFVPTSGGAQVATLTVDGPDVTVPATGTLTGTGSLAPALTIAPSPFSFGPVTIGQPSSIQKFTVKNTGGITVHVSDVGFSGGDADQFQRTTTTCPDADLDPGEFCMVKVRFRPEGTPGPRSTQLVVTSDELGTTDADLSGTAVGV